MKAIEGKFDTRLSAWRQYGKNGNNTGKTYDTLTRARKAKEIDHAFIKGVYYVNKKEADEYLAALESEPADSNQETSAEYCSEVLMTKVLAFMVDWAKKNGGAL